MIYFNNDYSEGCHPAVLERLTETNLVQTPGYGTDEYCLSAGNRLRALCGKPDLGVFFLVGGTQANMTVISAALRPHQGVIGAGSAHIHTHETGAVEASGHKVLTVPGRDGKLSAGQVEALAASHRQDPDREHTVQPKMVYISHPTEWGTLYSREELEAISRVCKAWGLYLFLDGARLGYGLAADGDVTLADMARLCDVFTVGGTKGGALFGEAVVISNAELSRDFRYAIKQRGGMLAKGRLLGLQFDALLENGLYFTIAAHANRMADQIRSALEEGGFSLYLPGRTNQIFALIPEDRLAELEKRFVFSPMGRAEDGCPIVRICTSWATRQEHVELLCQALKNI